MTSQKPKLSTYFCKLVRQGKENASKGKETIKSYFKEWRKNKVFVSFYRNFFFYFTQWLNDDMRNHISLKFQYWCKIKPNFQNREPTLENSSAHTVQPEPFTKTPTEFSAASPARPSSNRRARPSDRRFQVFPVLTTHYVSHNFGLICGLFWPVSASWI